MKSFAVLAAVAGIASAQSGLGSCAQLCVNNMATIANSQFQCGQSDTNCFCTKSNWAYGIRDCSRQACGDVESAQAVAWAAGQCAQAAVSASNVPAAIPILTGALASVTGSAASAAASVVGSLLPGQGAVSSLTGSAASQASGALGSATSAASGALASATSAASGALASASSAVSGALASASSAASGALASGQSGASSLRSVVNSATSAAGGAASSAPPAGGAAAPLQTGLPVLAGAGLIAAFFL